MTMQAERIAKHAYAALEGGQPSHTAPAPRNGPFGHVQAALLRSWRDGSFSLWLVALAFWLFAHGMRGICTDASLYMARALADLDPAGVGRDMAFAHDGQSRFSLFPILLDHLVAALGTGPTAILLAVTATAVWLIAFCGLVGQFLPARFIPVAILCVALLPDGYGPVGTFHYAEVLAIPRPFAESLVLFALWALIAGHDWRAFFLLIGASFIHPIMALAGWGVFGLVLCREDRRWYGVAVLVCVGIVALAFLGVPVVHRLVTPIDADLRGFAAYRIPYLFPTKWPVQSFGYVLVEAATMFIAASFFEKRRRFVLIAAVIVGIGGIVAQIVLGDLASRLLIIQAQLWRTEWLAAALGAAAFGIAAVELWKRDARGHIVLALLCLAWLQNGALLATAITAALALFVHFRMRITAPISWRFVYATWAVVGGLVIFLVVNHLASYKELISHIPRDAYSPGEYLWGEPSLAFLIVALVLALHAASRWALLAPAEKLAAFALLLAAVWLWDTRSGFQRLFDTGRHPPALTALIASRPGEVLWVGGLAEGWFLTGRPQWASRQQGSSTIFSRELTVQWRERMQFLVAHGLAERDAVVAFHMPPARELPRITLAGTHALCTRQDAPAWIIAPIWDGAAIPAELKPHYWRPDQPNFLISDETTYFEWHRISAYAVLPCAGT